MQMLYVNVYVYVYLYVYVTYWKIICILIRIPYILIHILSIKTEQGEISVMKFHKERINLDDVPMSVS